MLEHEWAPIIIPLRNFPKCCPLPFSFTNPRSLPTCELDILSCYGSSDITVIKFFPCQLQSDVCFSSSILRI